MSDFERIGPVLDYRWRVDENGCWTKDGQQLVFIVSRTDIHDKIQFVSVAMGKDTDPGWFEGIFQAAERSLELSMREKRVWA